MVLPRLGKIQAQVSTPAKANHFANKLIKSLLGQAAHCAKKIQSRNKRVL